MANRRRPRAEDPNADSRTSVPGVFAPTAPAPPSPPSATGGAPKVKSTVNPQPIAPGGTPQARRTVNPQPILPKVPTIPKPSTPRQWYQPTPINQMPWQQNPASTPANVSVVTAPRWKLDEIARNESGFVQEFKNLLWDRYQRANETERQSVFWQGVKQNPELAAASFVRRALTNMADANSWINGESAPTMDRALASTVATNEVRQWLDWVRGQGRRPRGA